MFKKAIIVEDEFLAQEELSYLIRQHSSITIEATFDDGLDVLKYLQNHQVDAIFLDINIPSLDGVLLAQNISKFAHKPYIIFITAYKEHALEGYELNIIDYLLKPFSPTRFKQAIDRFLIQFEQKELSLDEDQSENRFLAEKSNRLVVRVKNDIKIIPVTEVSHFEAEDDYISIHTQGGRYLKKMTMKQLEESLDPGKFARVHRSFMINMNEISGIEPYERDSYLVKLRSGVKIPVSKTGYTRLRLVLGM